jgi:hypothetical protein
MKEMPIGTQDFETLIESGFLYVDKTRQIYELLKNRIYFLSRPRRFGKSLLLSTIEAVFRGKRELFEGLYIYDKWNWDEAFPVIRIDFSNMFLETPELLTVSLDESLSSSALKHNIELSSSTLSGKFAELIEALYEKTGQKIVVLVDEYDRAMVNNLGDADILEANRIILRNFYSTIKACDRYLRFVFITGVSKFAGVSIFSGINNLHDITLTDKFAGICGYTQEELEYYFMENIDILAAKTKKTKKAVLDDIKIWYNGYTWDGAVHVYNPFSTLCLFANNKFMNYWIETATPDFLIKALARIGHFELPFNDIEILADDLIGSSLAKVSVSQLLFQTGYLTIKKVQSIDNDIVYTLGSPNNEVRLSLASDMLKEYCGNADTALTYIKSLKSEIIKSIENIDADLFVKTIESIRDKHPFRLLTCREASFHLLLMNTLILMGFDVSGEVSTGFGIADIVWKYNEDTTIIIEMKYVYSKTEARELERERIFKELRYEREIGNVFSDIAADKSRLPTEAEVEEEMKHVEPDMEKEKEYSENIKSRMERKLDEALKQIIQRGYYKKYQRDGSKEILAGIVFAERGKKMMCRFEGA